MSPAVVPSPANRPYPSRGPREYVDTWAEERRLLDQPSRLLFVWPEDDQFLAPAAGKPSVDKIPTARFVTTPGGLFAWYDDPDRCAALVAEGL